MPNAWDPGTARYLVHLGFPAIATTSSGFAFSRALPDTDWAVSRDDMLKHIGDIATSAADVPVSADFESGYAHDPEEVFENVGLCLRTGVAGLSIEDATGDPDRPLYDIELAAERISAARRAIDSVGSRAVLTGRAECFLVQAANPLDESIKRLRRYAEAGADVLYAPGLKDAAEIRAIVEAVAPKPVNVLAGTDIGLSIADLAELGVRRISIGSGLARAAWEGFMSAAEEIAGSGTFHRLAAARPFSDLNSFFRRERSRP